MTKTLLRRIRWNGLSALQQRRHITRLDKMLSAIQDRYPGVKHLEQIRLKHGFWLRDIWMSQQGLAPSTQTDYLRSLSILIAALDREQWLSCLGLDTDHRNGGRPRKVVVVKSRKFYKPNKK